MSSVRVILGYLLDFPTLAPLRFSVSDKPQQVIEAIEDSASWTLHRLDDFPSPPVPDRPPCDAVHVGRFLWRQQTFVRIPWAHSPGRASAANTIAALRGDRTRPFGTTGRWCHRFPPKDTLEPCAGRQIESSHPGNSGWAINRFHRVSPGRGQSLYLVLLVGGGGTERFCYAEQTTGTRGMLLCT